MKRTALAVVFLLLGVSARASELAGVTMPETAEVGGKLLRLNGQGLRTKLFFKIYVAGLYLESPSKDAAAVVSADEPKRVVMHFLYKKVTRKQMTEAWQDGFHDNSPSEEAKLQAQIAQFCSWMSDLSAGQEIVVTYEPAAGTTVEVAGAKKGSIAGADFMRALFRVWLGDHPPTGELKSGMLGIRS